ncbi:MAG: acetyl-CoA carboxylase biotin carboxyl carrier protein subunit [Bacteroidales bacterium]|jgi:biotin carboxyl carrier protein|nr:acetyl-CoA carboxylase biotin carboxyl carrier protein subunit [Bacteroidales bacterium]
MKKYKFTINDTSYEAKILSVVDQVITLELNDSTYEVTLDKENQQTKTPKLVVQAAPVATANDVAKTAPATALGDIKSPLPGTITGVLCKVGDTISIGQKVVTLEAMKMENSIESDKAGVVKEIKVGKGTAVMEGDILIVIG